MAQDIRSYNQSGGITAGTVNIGKQARHLDAEGKQKLLDMMPDKSGTIFFSATNGGDTHDFAREIMQFVKSQGYNVFPGIGLVVGGEYEHEVVITKASNGYDIEVR